jgi:hypothetical protein
MPFSLQILSYGDAAKPRHLGPHVNTNHYRLVRHHGSASAGGFRFDVRRDDSRHRLRRSRDFQTAPCDGSHDRCAIRHRYVASASGVQARQSCEVPNSALQRLAKAITASPLQALVRLVVDLPAQALEILAVEHKRYGDDCSKHAERRSHTGPRSSHLEEYCEREN